jgi:hypothetical protein
MTKKEAASKTGGGSSLAKECGKLIVISTMIVLVLGLGILTWKKRDKLTMGKKKEKQKTPPPVQSTGGQQQRTDPQANWNLRNEIKKLEARQQNNLTSRRSSGGDPLAD